MGAPSKVEKFMREKGIAATALRIPGEIFAMKRRFFSFNLGFRILSRGCKTEAVLLP